MLDSVSVRGCVKAFYDLPGSDSVHREIHNAMNLFGIQHKMNDVSVRVLVVNGWVVSGWVVRGYIRGMYWRC